MVNIKLIINSQNKLEVDLRLRSDDKLQNVCWDSTTVELKIDLNDIAFNSVENLNSNVFTWLLNVVHLHLKIVNVPEQLISISTNTKFFNSLVDKIIHYNNLKYLKLIVPQVNAFKCLYFKHLAELPNLIELDISELAIQEDEKNSYLSSIIEFLRSISPTSMINHILLPSYLKQKVLSLDADNELFTAIHDALLNCQSLVEIDPLPTFNQLNVPLRTILGRKQGFDLGSIYLQYDQDHRTAEQLKGIYDPTPELRELINAKFLIHEHTLEKVTKLLPMIQYMLAENIYWLDRILREKFNDSKYILECLYAVQAQENSNPLWKQYLFKMLLEGIGSDLVAGRFVEINPDIQSLTTFIRSRDRNSDKTVIDSSLKTLLKFNLIFNIHEDQDLSKILSNLAQEFVFGYGGVRGYYDNSRLLPCDKLGDLNFLIYKLLCSLRDCYNSQKSKSLLFLAQQEELARSKINEELAAAQNELLLSFNNLNKYSYTERLFYSEQLIRSNIYYQELEEECIINDQLLRERLWLYQQHNKKCKIN